jgi:hypothetical protein
MVGTLTVELLLLCGMDQSILPILHGHLHYLLLHVIRLLNYGYSSVLLLPRAIGYLELVMAQMVMFRFGMFN